MPRRTDNDAHPKCRRLLRAEPNASEEACLHTVERRQSRICWPRCWRALGLPSAEEGLSLRLLAAQISKAMERFIGQLFLPRLHCLGTFGSEQFAYCPGRGARDAFLLFLLVWFEALGTGHRVAVYCSDVSGAFDKVSTERLTAKLRSAIPHPKVLSVLRSWLGPRPATVIAKGTAFAVSS
eukprot:13778125-Alexandrium_andersonii.AAC.1